MDPRHGRDGPREGRKTSAEWVMEVLLAFAGLILFLDSEYWRVVGAIRAGRHARVFAPQDLSAFAGLLAMVLPLIAARKPGLRRALLACSAVLVAGAGLLLARLAMQRGTS